MRRESLDELRARALRDLGELPEPLRRLRRRGPRPEPYPVTLSPRLQRLADAG